MAEHTFKTIYFPSERTRVGSSTRVTISIPTHTDDVTPPAFLTFVRSLSSRGFRAALGDLVLEDLEQRAEAEGRSLSNLCFRLLLAQYQQLASNGPAASSPQLVLPFLGMLSDPLPEQPRLDLGVTFRESKRQRVHGWYPYVEGFSATYVRDALLRHGAPPRTVYDPFGGAGTTQVTAACLGIPSFYSEINPFMAFVADTKVRAASWARRHLQEFSQLSEAYLAHLTNGELDARGRTISLAEYESAFPERDFFEERHLRHLLAARDLALSLPDAAPEGRALLLLACAANAVRSSNMTRRADLRRRRPDEYKGRVVDVASFVAETIRRMAQDIRALPLRMEETVRVSEDCRAAPLEYGGAFEFAITSPPYLNGTNYFRNTKIELWLLGFIRSEGDLRNFRARAVAAGINNISAARPKPLEFDDVEAVAGRLDEKADDRRIPMLVRHYFSDMHEVLNAVHRTLAPGGRFLFDIGDSQFYGVHVPTEKLIAQIARAAGFSIEHEHVLARRHSRDKSPLVQVELVLRKPKASTFRVLGRREQQTRDQIKAFQSDLPHKVAPYASRSWGHPLHSLCSYQGKLKPGIAHWLVKLFVPSGSRVLDPLGGVGTVALEAALLGHHAVSNDKSPLAATIASGKVNPPSLPDASAALERLLRRMKSVRITSEDRHSTEFGLNATVADYYHPRTLDEILRARRVFLDSGAGPPAETFLWGCLLHILHGNRPYALSRTSHPITPFRPTGPATYKSLQQKLTERIERMLRAPLPPGFRPGVAIKGDFRDLAAQAPHFNAIITSPPFLGMRFDRPNWLRLWFCGWTEDDFHKTSLSFLEREQTKSRDCYRDLFTACHTLLDDQGLLVMHIGSGGHGDLPSDLRALSAEAFALLGEITENVQGIEQHGVRDKGLTTTHHYLFLRPL